MSLSVAVSPIMGVSLGFEYVNEEASSGALLPGEHAFLIDILLFHVLFILSPYDDED